VEIKLYTFITLELDGGKLSTTHSVLSAGKEQLNSLDIRLQRPHSQLGANPPQAGNCA